MEQSNLNGAILAHNSISPAPYAYISSVYSSSVSGESYETKTTAKKNEPSFMKPTVNYKKPRKEVNRIKLSRAIEKVR